MKKLTIEGPRNPNEERLFLLKQFKFEYFKISNALKKGGKYEYQQLCNQNYKFNFQKINAISKLLYLKNCITSQIIPNHILNTMSKIENLFNPKFLTNKTNNNFLEIIAIKIIKKDITQAHWKINNLNIKLENNWKKLNTHHANISLKLKNLIKKYNNNIVNIKTHIIIYKKYNKIFKKNITKPLKHKIQNINNNNNNNNEIPQSARKNYKKTHIQDDKNKNYNFIQTFNNNKKKPINILDYYNNLHFQNRVINLTNINIPNNIKNILNLGENFNHNPKNKKIIANNVTKLIADIEYITDELETSDNHKNAIRNSTNNIIHNFLKIINNKKSKNNNIPKNNYNETFKQINTSKLNDSINKDLISLKKFIKNNPNITLIKTDKTKKYVWMHKTDFEKKMKDILDDKNTYKIIRTDPTSQLEKNLNNFNKKLIKYKFLNKSQANIYINKFSDLPKMYPLLKMHKQNQPFRPIVDSTNSIFNKLSTSYLNSLKHLNNNNNYDIKNSFELKEKLDKIEINSNHTISSYDVVSLFTNIPLSLTYKLINDNWDKIKAHTEIQSKSIYLEGLKLILNNTYFTFNNQIYRQISGLPMGGKLSTILSGLTLNHILDTALSNTKIKPALLTKYIDDLLIISNHEDNIQLFKELNNCNNQIKFTLENEKNNMLNYLDITLIKNNNQKILTKFYKKDITSDLLLNYNSNHPKHIINNIANALIKRSINLTSKQYINDTKKLIYQILKNNGYPETIINKYWKKNYFLHCNNTKPITMEQSALNSSETKNTDKNKKESENKIKSNNKYKSLTYINKLTTKIAKIYKKYDIENLDFTYKTNNKTKLHLPNHKDKTSLLKKQGIVYKIKCSCNKIYIGHTKNTLEARLKGHKYTFKENYKSKTSLSQHYLQTKHNINFENCTILEREKNTKKRKVLESTHIYMNLQNSINSKEECFNIKKYSSSLDKIKILKNL